MTEQEPETNEEMRIIRVLKNQGIINITSNTIPQPIDTLREIKGLYNVMKVYLAAVVDKDIKSGKLSIKDVVTLGREMEKLNEMLFIFKVKLGELNKDDKPKKSELIMEMVGDMSEQERLKIGRMLEVKYQILEEEEQNGKENEQSDG